MEQLEDVHTIHIGHWNDHNVEEMVNDLVLNTGVQYVKSKKNIRGVLNISQQLNVSGMKAVNFDLVIDQALNTINCLISKHRSSNLL